MELSCCADELRFSCAHGVALTCEGGCLVLNYSVVGCGSSRTVGRECACSISVWLGRVAWRSSQTKRGDLGKDTEDFPARPALCVPCRVAGCGELRRKIHPVRFRAANRKPDTETHKVV